MPHSVFLSQQTLRKPQLYAIVDGGNTFIDGRKMYQQIMTLLEALGAAVVATGVAMVIASGAFVLQHGGW